MHEQNVLIKFRSSHSSHASRQRADSKAGFEAKLSDFGNSCMVGRVEGSVVGSVERKALWGGVAGHHGAGGRVPGCEPWRDVWRAGLLFLSLKCLSPKQIRSRRPGLHPLASPKLKTRAAFDKAVDAFLEEACPTGTPYNGPGISPSFRVAREMLAFDATDRANASAFANAWEELARDCG